MISKVNDYGRKHLDLILKFSKIFSITTVSQILIQLIGLFCGILVIRNFTISEYAFYTLSNTLLGAMNILADGGIVIGVMVEGGKVWKDRQALGSIMNTGLKLRKLFSIASIGIAGIVLIYLLNKNGAPVWYSFIILACLLPSFYANLTDAIYSVGPKLNQKVLPLQINEIYANIGRLLLTLSTVFFFPFTSIALLVNGIPRLYANIKLRKIASEDVNFDAPINEEAKANILKMVKRILPMNIYHIFSVQITIWILSIFGTLGTISQAGALFRIGAMLSVLSIVSSTLIIPRIARLNENKDKIFRAIGISQIFITCILIIIVGMVAIFSNYIIFLFGKNYYGLNHELVLTIIIFALNVFTIQQYNINAS